MSKYGNKKTVVDGEVFDSALEARRWCELRLLQRSGAISDLQRQVKFVLQDGFTKNGKRYREIAYIADFVYVCDGEIVLEDTKGHRTEVYKVKRKMFEYKYPFLTIREVRG